MTEVIVHHVTPNEVNSDSYTIRKDILADVPKYANANLRYREALVKTFGFDDHTCYLRRASPPEFAFVSEDATVRQLPDHEEFALLTESRKTPSNDSGYSDASSMHSVE
ncbi:hypothetical protein H4R18_004358 [Coemansia javaensis]|uniref:Uncharacterized protein n=1 Tax=Coemansia javaensis TaxID=2761396 RepID=A0A9W8HCH3_9FUNG|nr:hypothetical protein H4R18_004358 [Coemansia javaensis]